MVTTCIRDMKVVFICLIVASAMSAASTAHASSGKGKGKGPNKNPVSDGGTISSPIASPVNGGSPNTDNSGGGKQRMSQYDINAYPLNTVVCDPLGNTSPTSPKQGIKADLYFRTSGQPRYTSVIDYVSKLTKSTQNVFFSNINVPTQLFTKGFRTETNGLLKDDSGNLLIEDFGLKMKTTIRLSPDDPEGVYEFAILSDDGSIMSVKDGDVWKQIINNDGIHETRLGCSNTRIHMKRDSALQAEILYYQGPRFHVADVLLWRKVPTDKKGRALAGRDPKCGHAGTNYWFDPKHNSRPKAQYLHLTNRRGWKVVGSQNFYLPQEESHNPCTPGNTPQISNVVSSNVTSSTAELGWTTNVPTTSQVLVTEVNTGEGFLTESDNVLRTQHNVEVTGLLPGTAYILQAVSVGEDLGRIISPPVEINTAP